MSDIVQINNTKVKKFWHERDSRKSWQSYRNWNNWGIWL